MPRYNTIFAGPTSENMPQVQEAPAASGGLLPGTFAVITAGVLTYATAGAAAHLFVVQDNYLALKGVDDAWEEDSRAIGMELLDKQFFNVRVPTGVNVARGAALTIGASGKAALATGDEVYVVAYAEEAYNNTSGVDQLVRVRAAKGYLTPAGA